MGFMDPEIVHRLDFGPRGARTFHPPKVRCFDQGQSRNLRRDKRGMGVVIP